MFEEGETSAPFRGILQVHVCLEPFALVYILCFYLSSTFRLLLAPGNELSTRQETHLEQFQELVQLERPASIFVEHPEALAPGRVPHGESFNNQGYYIFLELVFTYVCKLSETRCGTVALGGERHQQVSSESAHEKRVFGGCHAVNYRNGRPRGPRRRPWYRPRAMRLCGQVLNAARVHLYLFCFQDRLWTQDIRMYQNSLVEVKMIVRQISIVRDRVNCIYIFLQDKKQPVPRSTATVYLENASTTQILVPFSPECRPEHLEEGIVVGHNAAPVHLVEGSVHGGSGRLQFDGLEELHHLIGRCTMSGFVSERSRFCWRS